VSQVTAPSGHTWRGYRVFLSFGTPALEGILVTSALDTLRRDFGGDIIEPGDAGYEAAARSRLVAGSPAYVLRPKTVADVQAAVRFASGSGLALSVRGGGHGFAGFGTNDGGIVIDLGALAGVEVVEGATVADGAALAGGGGRLVRIGGGATWGPVAEALAPHGLAISSGDTKSVGVGGLTLSGGMGWKVRRYGLALDSLVAAELVTADGAVVTASADEHPDLFWAIRGGGGNFGVVTSFEFAAHPTTRVFFGKVSFPAAEAAVVLQGWADYLRTAPEELTSIATLANPFAGGPEAPVEIHVAFDGDDADAADRALAPIRALGTVVADDVELMAYADVLVEGATPPPGVHVLAHDGLVDRESVAETLAILAEAGTSPGSPSIAVRSLGGAMSRVPGDATAYAHRQAELMVTTFTGGPAPVIDAHRPALDALWDRLAPHLHGAYANFLSTADETDVTTVYPEPTYERLAAVKRRYDPSNLFARNHNVRPGRMS
jgi:FAD/FMN-containing dehydrogenase